MLLPMSEAHGGNADTTPQGEEMNTNSEKLALRRSSIRSLTVDELRTAHGGKPKFSEHGTQCATSDKCKTK